MNQAQRAAEITLQMKLHNNYFYLSSDETDESLLALPCLRVRIEHPDGRSRIYPVYRQNAMIYGELSDYIKHHGCACCSLTSVLAAMRRSLSQNMPQDTITQVEKTRLPRWEYEKNYDKPLSRQMPVSLYGISQILQKESISCRLVASFDRQEAMEIIDRHLSSGNPVIFETSRIRYRNRMIVSLNDRRYAGSYHTMVMLGYDSRKRVICADSADRDWAGQRQRLKRAELSELMNYMFPQKNTEDNRVYFHKRKNNGGFILVYAWERLDNMIQKNIDKMNFIP